MRHAIRWHRSQTWGYQDRAGVPRTIARHAELRTQSVPFLWWIDHLWQRRQRAASKLRPRLPPAARGSLRAFAGCLAPLVDREDSTWDPTRENPKSGAYGLPQALPGSKMKSAGRDWASNAYTQLRWMRGYVIGRYGSCAAALSHSYTYGWY